MMLNEDFKLLSSPELGLAGLGYKDLIAKYPRVAEIFDQYNLLVMSVVTNSEDPINELFVRLNRSKPLTGAEIRNAMGGPAPTVIRQISRHEFFTINIAFTVIRGQDQNAAAQILLFEYHGALQETKKTTLDAFVEDATRQPRAKVELAGRKVVDLLDEMQEIFLPKDRLLSSAGQVPIYYWFSRSRNPKEYPLIREFLVRFEEERTENRALVKNNPKDKAIEAELVEFDQFNRNTNDLSSHEGRMKILEARFARFKKRPSSK